MILVGALALPGTLLGQQGTDPCAGTAARQFDFWLGEWAVIHEIASESGGWETYVARSTVTTALGGCALIERWRGRVRFHWEGMREPVSIDGLSVRAPAPDGSWRIYWMDSRSPMFGTPWVGRFQSGEGTLEGTFLRPYATPDGEEGVTRIRFFDITATTVEWELAVSPDGGTTWRPLWRMHFQRVEP